MSLHYELFYGDGCPTCEEVRLVLATQSFKLGFSYSEHETWNNSDNASRMSEILGTSDDAVPMIYDAQHSRIWRGDGDLVSWLKNSVQ
jgi:hypothetical protein